MENTNIQPKKSHIIRVDKNLSENSLDWLKIFGQDTNLCFDIILYISNNAQRDIFNFWKIKLIQFVLSMQYKKNKLQYKAELLKKTEHVKKKTYNSRAKSKKSITN